MLIVALVLAVIGLAAFCICGDLDNVSNLPSYKPEFKVEGAIRCFGSELKGQTEVWEKGFLKYQPNAVFSNNFMTSSEGAMAGLYTGLSVRLLKWLHTPRKQTMLNRVFSGLFATAAVVLSLVRRGAETV